MKTKIKSLLIAFLISTIAVNFGLAPMLVKKTVKNEQSEDGPESSAVYANIGAWIIIGGDREDHDLLNLIIYGCDRVYNILTGLGVNVDDIRYLANDVDGYTNSELNIGSSSLANIDVSFESWLPPKVDANKGLGLYLFDHGGIDEMCLPGENLTPTHLDDLLDNLETTTGCKRSVIFYEACHAGSFIGDLSQEDRMIITSTDQIHAASVNPSKNWATFSEAFWSSLAKCKTVGQAFEDARDFVIFTGHEQSQWPWIDDNHDGIPHQTDGYGNLPNGGDGVDALNTIIGNLVSCPGHAILLIPNWIFIDTSEFSYEMNLIKPPGINITDIYLKFISPNFHPEELIDEQPVIVGEEGIHNLIQDRLPVIHEVMDDGEHGIVMDDGEHITVTVDINRLSADFEEPMSNPGEYQICAYSVDDMGIMSDVARSRVTFLDVGEEPPADRIPPTISIEEPVNSTVLAGNVPIKVEADDNLALDRVQIYIDGIRVHDEMMIGPTYPQVQHNLDTSAYSNGPHNLTAIAYDHVGLKTQTSFQVEFKNEGGADDGNILDIPGYPVKIILFCSAIGVISILSHYLRKIKELPQRLS